jgi:hypothetical protein
MNSTTPVRSRNEGGRLESAPLPGGDAQIAKQTALKAEIESDARGNVSTIRSANRRLPAVQQSIKTEHRQEVRSKAERENQSGRPSDLARQIGNRDTLESTRLQESRNLRCRDQGRDLEALQYRFILSLFEAVGRHPTEAQIDAAKLPVWPQYSLDTLNVRGFRLSVAPCFLIDDNINAVIAKPERIHVHYQKTTSIGDAIRLDK